MKYSRLTKEQFEELQQEFINFLATQSITAQEWQEIKAKKPEVAEEELDIFSDLVWEGVLQKAQYLENLSPQQLFLFKVAEKEMHLISLKITEPEIDITTTEGYRWLQQNYAEDSVEFFTASKPFSEDKSGDIFSLIQQGAVITKGELYQFFEDILRLAKEGE
ncbi:DUF6495 family protein [Marinirhabdus gelatinilytica]|uniref:Histidyl-tRNA synthetase n=1 Tax=Marinirhabdus gelatinilytica TaxID=1703343 RepID=A0A370QFS3_9FLAO|nr:DUF6495 family protein [Marinirhabdus gelatinilytica]RDK87214.1 hypothetical protein C8D94_102398 [Marinirhabdus gelatinilytica]